MGNDGGSIPKRRELVKEAARALTVSELKANALESLGHAWNNDPLTGQPLDKDNVVSDWRGRLYNYESILQGLMPPDDNTESPPSNPDSEELTFASTGIKSLRDIVKLRFHRHTPPGTKKDVWACPISLKELGPSVKAVYLVPCGHVFAELAIKEIQESRCPECSEEFKSENVVPILPVEESELRKQVKRMDDLKAAGLAHSLKKDKKDKKKKRKAEDDAQEGSKADKKRAVDESIAADSVKKGASGRISGINNPMAASLTAKVMAEQEELSKRRKMASSRG
ncbi:Rtf2 RING-finger-domain-containing protein [Colletotrichum navitas]|uniref:Rtf2 RING-finger-domain-containing protein n=1 Tax=Colletotrichum navitas TaxID=681940 RepID=A0AAD8UXZ0_9PEZI|nr:Rtf2 RING-finger-domain-containing protein [Colletotrichum navitas]KAK1561695.1 Rtf2 RING-finger-domain-containing protein [Colletotrichum navitas]